MCGLSFDEMCLMNIGDALDFIYTYVEMKNPKEERSRKATQKDIDGLFHGN